MAFQNLKQLSRRWIEDQQGNVAMQFGIMMIAIMVVAGAAIDFSREETLDRELSAAVDGAAIAAARFAMNESDAETIKTYAGNYLQESIHGFALKSSEIVVGTDSISIAASAELPTTILALASIDKFDIHTQATAEFVISKDVEVALVLDTSESMKGAPLDALKDAANIMIDTVVIEGSDSTKLAIVPFNNFVNVGLGQKNESWLDVPSEYTQTKTQWVTDTSKYSAMGCYNETYSCTRDGAPSTCWRDVCPGGAEVPKKEESVTSTYSWYGCVVSREAPLDITETSFHTKKTRGQLSTNSWGCNAPIHPLTNKTKDLKDAISNLTVSAETYTAQGLAWGYRVLTPGKPFTEAAPFADFADGKGEKVIVLMSDGANTRMRDSSSNPTHWHPDPDGSNAQMIANCDLIKNADIKIYTIAFGIADTTTKALLKQCASAPENAFVASDANALKQAFKDVSNDLVEIALTH